MVDFGEKEFGNGKTEPRKRIEEAKIDETEYLKQSELDQHLDQSPGVDHHSEKSEDFVDHARETPKALMGCICPKKFSQKKHSEETRSMKHNCYLYRKTFKGIF